jgi:hypothetical protein
MSTTSPLQIQMLPTNYEGLLLNQSYLGFFKYWFNASGSSLK